MSYLSGVSGIRVEQTAPRIQVRATAIQPGAEQYINLDSMYTLRTSTCCLLCWTGLNQFMGRLGQSNMHHTLDLCPDHLQINQVGIECTKAKEQLRSYCPNLYTVSTTQIFSWRSSQKPKIFFLFICDDDHIVITTRHGQTLIFQVPLGQSILTKLQLSPNSTRSSIDQIFWWWSHRHHH